MLAEPLQIAVLVGEVLDELGVSWAVGGSVASSLHGIPRSTQDIDLVAELRASHVRTLVDRLEAGFYVDDSAIREAVHRRSSFNVIHLDTMTKVDVFIPRMDPLSRSQILRRQQFEVFPGVVLPIASPEDIVLQKLDWFRRGGGVSQRQWRDVLGVLRVSGDQLELTYLRELAESEGLGGLLEDALAEAVAADD